MARFLRRIETAALQLPEKDRAALAQKLASSIDGYDAKGPAGEKDGWDKAQIVGRLFGAVVTPLLVFALGLLLTDAVGKSEQLLALSIEVLKAQPPETEAQESHA